MVRANPKSQILITLSLLSKIFLAAKSACTTCRETKCCIPLITWNAQQSRSVVVKGPSHSCKAVSWTFISSTDLYPSIWTAFPLFRNKFQSKKVRFSNQFMVFFTIFLNWCRCFPKYFHRFYLYYDQFGQQTCQDFFVKSPEYSRKDSIQGRS